MNSHPISHFFRLLTISSLAVLLFTSLPANAQEAQTSNGSVASTSRITLTIRTTEGRYQLFVLDNTTKKPASIPVGAQVRITSSEDDGVYYASEVDVTQQPATGTSAAGSYQVFLPEEQTQKHNNKQKTHRYRLGVRGGVALDP